MTTILTTFIIALILSLALTPLAGWLGARFGALDKPQKRKAHTIPVPRIGGLAIFVAFFLTLALGSLFMTEVSNKLILDRKTVFFLVGALVVFAVGFFDDFHRLGPSVKFLFQIIGASIAFWGGLRIEVFSIFGVGLHFGILSYLVTVFWFVLFINAVNLIDGLDGLAAGIAFFASLVLIILSVLRGEHFIGMLFAALSGACLGFLRYNFNPASIFMGDSGSYFLGYVIAGLSIMGSIKSQVGAAMLIPIIALGVPLFDTILSPLRRFVRGRRMFLPDDGHIHHRLVEMGLTTKKVVWILYGITFCLCIMAIFVVNIRDERAGLFLIVLGAGAVVFIRKLGYFEYFASDKLYGWFKDISDEAGFSHDRRSFLNLQIEIGESVDLEELWVNVCRALEKLKFDMGELAVVRKGQRAEVGGQRSEVGKGQRSDVGCQMSEGQGTEIDPQITQITRIREEGIEGTKNRGQRTEDRGQGLEIETNSGIDPDEIKSEKAFHGAGELKDLGIRSNAGIKAKDGMLELKDSGIDGDSGIQRQFVWARNGFDRAKDICKESLLKLELPLIDNGNKMMGTLWLVKDLNSDSISHYTLRRVEHLRRTVIGTLGKMRG